MSRDWKVRDWTLVLAIIEAIRRHTFRQSTWSSLPTYYYYHLLVLSHSIARFRRNLNLKHLSGSMLVSYCSCWFDFDWLDRCWSDLKLMTGTFNDDDGAFLPVFKSKNCSRALRFAECQKLLTSQLKWVRILSGCYCLANVTSERTRASRDDWYYSFAPGLNCCGKYYCTVTESPSFEFSSF